MSIEENKKIIEKYPFLAFHNYDGSIDYEATWYDSMPRGWRIAFGDLMMDDVKACLEKANYVDKFCIEDIKEKYGELRFYYGGVPSRIYDELDTIVETYSALSYNICIECGEIDVPSFKRGWIEPICLKCYSSLAKNKGLDSKAIYQNYLDDMDLEHQTLANKLIFTRYVDGESEKYEIDIKPSVKKVVDAWGYRQIKRLRELDENYKFDPDSLNDEGGKIVQKMVKRLLMDK